MSSLIVAGRGLAVLLNLQPNICYGCKWQCKRGCRCLCRQCMLAAFKPSLTLPKTARIFQRARLPSLVPSQAVEKLMRQIDALESQGASHVVRVSLNLLNASIDGAHTIAKADEANMTSNMVHSISHRSEK
ncbi:hypothetical protein K437DRAFT_12060 [Tilletiaria anomala UBC 951]|uniref:Uncharacterized protein n=1 Tax=Tilletiaria anomala (strain ATCC 24038 / CBS 436.72 / UBC 951) TaxID=1037660 RepID=A0A066VCF2_TILAU|nr:uncharacterized protein K437DRAFT_12060 [Tilletiaria anomala UBC 951]KDN39402.1 hypothetical protein K437DRAFT_12060 [Tilletiaria anomala UBC 951]